MTVSFLGKLNTVFAARRRRARSVSFVFSFMCHGGVLALVVYVAVTLPGRFSSSKYSSGGGYEEAPREMAMVEVASRSEGEGVPPGLDRTSAIARIRQGVDEASQMDAHARQKALEQWKGMAALVSDSSVTDIASFLGGGKKEYKPRAAYCNEVNPNLNMAKSVIAQVDVKKNAVGENVYILKLVDAEKDAVSLSLSGRPAREMDAVGVAFDKKVLSGSGGMQLKGAKVADIKRWKRKEDARGLKGCIVTLKETDGKTFDLHIDGAQAVPFKKERIRFISNIKGVRLHADTEETLHTEYFDTASSIVYSVTELPDENGEKRARVVLLDAKGERLIFIARGKAAEEQLSQMGAVTSDSNLRNIYLKAVAPLLPGLRQSAQAAGEKQQKGKETWPGRNRSGVGAQNSLQNQKKNPQQSQKQKQPSPLR